MQNVTIGTFRDGIHDDQFGGPAPDNAHLTGVILRLNDDGTTPKGNPFFKAGAEMGGEVGANIQKVFAYGVRNSFGLAIDPLSGNLWDEENGSDSFDEMNRVDAGANNGWVQIMGPVERIRDYKSLEIVSGARLQQRRWPPELIADTPREALDRLFVLPGSHYNDPKFSWKNVLPPGAIGFVKGEGLGEEFEGDLFVGAATPRTVGGHLLRFKLTKDRKDIDLTASGLSGRVADNPRRDDLTGSESLLIGRDFGIGTDIVTGPNGNLFVVSLTKGAIYEIFRRPE
jgi:glucose/arabinose dehydrogenase